MASSAPGRFRTRTNTTGYAHPNCGSPGVGRGRVGIGVTLTVDCIAVPGRIRGRPQSIVQLHIAGRREWEAAAVKAALTAQTKTRGVGRDGRNCAISNAAQAAGLDLVAGPHRYHKNDSNLLPANAPWAGLVRSMSTGT